MDILSKFLLIQSCIIKHMFVHLELSIVLRHGYRAVASKVCSTGRGSYWRPKHDFCAVRMLILGPFIFVSRAAAPSTLPSLRPCMVKNLKLRFFSKNFLQYLTFYWSLFSVPCPLMVSLVKRRCQQPQCVTWAMDIVVEIPMETIPGTS